MTKIRPNLCISGQFGPVTLLRARRLESEDSKFHDYQETKHLLVDGLFGEWINKPLVIAFDTIFLS